MKKLLFLSLSVLAIAAVVTVKSVNTKSGMSSLMTQNIEALTQNESSTSWNCSSGVTHCSAKCGICGTEVNGSGRLTGSHKCS